MVRNWKSWLTRATLGPLGPANHLAGLAFRARRSGTWSAGFAQRDVGAAIRQEDPLYPWAKALSAVIPPDATYVFLDNYEAGKEIEVRYFLAPRRHILLPPEAPGALSLLHPAPGAGLVFAHPGPHSAPGAGGPGGPPVRGAWSRWTSRARAGLTGWITPASAGASMIDPALSLLRFLGGLGLVVFLGYALLAVAAAPASGVPGPGAPGLQLRGRVGPPDPLDAGPHLAGPPFGLGPDPRPFAGPGRGPAPHAPGPPGLPRRPAGASDSPLGLSASRAGTGSSSACWR